MLHSFSVDATGEFQQRVSQFISNATGRLVASLGTAMAQGEKDHAAFATTRIGDTVHIHWPQHVKSGDLLAEVIGLLATQLPTVIIHEGDKGWSEPEWTRDQRLRLFGIVSALQGIPQSFATTSSPLDIMRVAVWLRACVVALNRQGGVHDAVGSPLPSGIGGEKNASKYILKTLQGLKAGQTDENVLSAVSCLDILLSLWTKTQGDKALALIRKQKISWGTVLNAGAPTIKKKVNKIEITQVVTPLKPSRSPWLTKSEANHLSQLFTSLWGREKEFRENWVQMPAEMQHQRYREYVKQVASHFEQLKTVSSNVHAKLGHRKKWVIASVKAAGKEPKSKKDKTNLFAWSAAFFKLDLTKTGLSIVMTFSPAHYLTDVKYQTDEYLDEMWNHATASPGKKLQHVQANHLDPHVKALFGIWLERFAPIASTNKSAIPDSSNIADENAFAVLPVDDWEDNDT
jgi:hypothetical protein